MFGMLFQFRTDYIIHVVVSGGDNFNPRYRDKQAPMTNEQQTLLAERYPQIFAAIKAANIGIRASLFMQIDQTLLGNIARLLQVETKCGDTEMHDIYTIMFAHGTVDVRLYAMIPKTVKR